MLFFSAPEMNAGLITKPQEPSHSGVRMGKDRNPAPIFTLCLQVWELRHTPGGAISPPAAGSCSNIFDNMKTCLEEKKQRTPLRGVEAALTGAD